MMHRAHCPEKPESAYISKKQYKNAHFPTPSSNWIFILFIVLPVWQDKVADQYYIYFAFYLLLNMHITHLLDLMAPVIVPS